MQFDSPWNLNPAKGSPFGGRGDAQYWPLLYFCKISFSTKISLIRTRLPFLWNIFVRFFLLLFSSLSDFCAKTPFIWFGLVAIWPCEGCVLAGLTMERCLYFGKTPDPPANHCAHHTAKILKRNQRTEIWTGWKLSKSLEKCVASACLQFVFFELVYMNVHVCVFVYIFRVYVCVCLFAFLSLCVCVCLLLFFMYVCVCVFSCLYMGNCLYVCVCVCLCAKSGAMR